MNLAPVPPPRLPPFSPEWRREGGRRRRSTLEEMGLRKRKEKEGEGKKRRGKGLVVGLNSKKKR